MRITGLENNYYLAGNDIWVTVSELKASPLRMDVIVKNKRTNKLFTFILQPSLENTYHFNISIPIRGLFPEPNHLDINATLQQFEITFKSVYEENNIEDEIEVFTKHFIRGGVQKDGDRNWHLEEGQELIIGQWVEWHSVSTGIYPLKLVNGNIQMFYPLPDDIRHMPLKSGCNRKVIKFLNSLGGYQFYVFEQYEIKVQSKPSKTIGKIAQHLSGGNFNNLGVQVEQRLELYTKTPSELQEVIIDLVQSYDVYLLNESAQGAGKWQRLILESNEAIENSFDRSYHNKLTFSFANQVTKSL